MNTWFECKVKYEAIEEKTGRTVKVNLPYILDAVSYTEAEKRIHEEMEQYVSGEFLVPSIKPANYSDLFFYDDGDYWYKAKVELSTIDESAGREKKVANYMLVQASDLKEAYERIDESLKGMTVDYETTLVQKTQIADVFPYYPADEQEDVKSKAYKDE